MALKEIKRNLELLKQSIQYLSQKKISPSEKIGEDFSSFNKQQALYHQKTFHTAREELQNDIEKMDKYDEHVLLLEKEIRKLSATNLDQNISVIAAMLDLVDQIPSEQELSSAKSKSTSSFSFVLPKNIPSEIRQEMLADMSELEKCYQSDCFRSAIILCGRLLEIALHRKYFDITNIDILDTNPGIGLGTLIAKLSEKGMHFDPGVTQQIHLINQVRIFSVHKKQEPFYPSSNQAQAMVLFTMDTLQKLFQ